METIERGGKSLTVVTPVTGLAVAGVYLNQVFQGVRPQRACAKWLNKPA